MSKNTKKSKNSAFPSAPGRPDVAKSAIAPVPPKPEPIKAAPVVTAPKAPVTAPAARPALPAPAAPAPLAQTGRVAFELVKPGASRVCVAGSFNGWKPEKAPLAPSGNGRWVGELSVNPGRYEYLFVVDGQWLPDPNAKESVQNPFGGKNSVLTVSA